MALSDKTRVIGLDNDPERLPPMIGKYLEIASPDHSYLFGEFDICPTGPDAAGHMRRACLAGAEKLVVQPLDSSRPPFRLRSTWPQVVAREGPNPKAR